MVEGAAGGFAEGVETFNNLQQGSDQHKMAGLAMQEKSLQIQITKQDMEKTKAMLEQQKKLMQDISKLNGMASTPGSTPPSPQDQARSHAGLYYQMAEAARARGLPEEAMKFDSEASKLDLNAANIDEKTATLNKDKAETTASLMSWVKEAEHDPKEFQRRWNASLMSFQNSYGEKSPLAGKQPTPELIDALTRTANSRKNEAEIAEKNAAAQRDKAQARLDDRTAALRDSQAKLADTRTKQVEKAGGAKGVTKKEQSQVDAIQTALDSIEDIQTTIAQNRDKTLTGVRGEGHAIMESLASAVGSTAETPARDVQSSTLVLKSVVQKALTGSNYSSKDKMEIASALSDVQKLGMTGKAGERRLDKLKGLLEQKKKEMAIPTTGEQSAISQEDYMKSIGLNPDGSEITPGE